MTLDDAASSPGTDQPAQTTKSLSNCRICRNDSKLTFVQKLKDLSGCRRTKFIHAHTHAKPHRYIPRKKPSTDKPRQNLVEPKADRKIRKKQQQHQRREYKTRTRLPTPDSVHSESTRSTPDQKLTQKHRSSPCFFHSRGQKGHFDLTLSQSLRQP